MRIFAYLFNINNFKKNTRSRQYKFLLVGLYIVVLTVDSKILNSSPHPPTNQNKKDFIIHYLVQTY